MSEEVANGGEPSRLTDVPDLPPAWKCEDPYKFSLPQPEDDPWKTMLKPLMEADKAKCAAWTDEVQNLLLFAGLFSAVVTGFAVESYKGLQEDPVVVLLAQIAAASGGNAQTNNSTGSSVSLAAFAPSPSTVRLNIFLFVSLILSLATVLIGIVSLQWLREHRHDDEFFTPQTSFAMLHMRTEALKRWRVPQIFAALPLLLQTALILFLAGVVELLVDLGHGVIIPVGVVIGLTLLFLVLTTILPTLQTLVLYRPSLGSNVNVPVPCPYKSPQSRAFRRLITSSHVGFLLVSTIFTALYVFLRSLFDLPVRLISSTVIKDTLFAMKDFITSIFHRITEVVQSSSSKIYNHMHRGSKFDTDDANNRYDLMQPQLDLHLTCKTWPDVDLSWMSIRDNYFQANQPKGSWLFEKRGDHTSLAGLYDLTMGMYREMLEENFSIDAQFHPPNYTDYHCMFSLAFPSTVQHDPFNMLRDSIIRRNQFLATFLKHESENYSPLRLFKRVYDEASVDIIRDEDLFIILHFLEARLRELSVPVSAVYKHLAEVYYRLLGYLYSHPHEMDTELPIASIPVPFNAELLWAMDVYGDADQPFTFQWAKTIHVFFESLAQNNYRFTTLERSFHVHPFFREFSYYFWRQLDWEIRSKKTLPTANSVLQAVSTLQLITSSMEETSSYVTKITATRFYAAAIHLQFYRRFPALVEFEPLAEVVRGLLPLLQRKLRDVNAVNFEEDTTHPEPRVLFGAGEMDPGDMQIFTDEWWLVLFHSLSTLGIQTIQEGDPTPGDPLPVSFPEPTHVQLQTIMT